MNFDEYLEFTDETAIYGDSALAMLASQSQMQTQFWIGLAYCAGKLNGEAGEIAEEVFKAMRDDKGRISESRSDALRSEIGDALYYIARLCAELGYSLDVIAQENMTKLRSRKARGVLQGKGSSR